MKPAADPHAPPIVQALDTAFRYLRWLGLLLAGLYLATGITAVQPDEQVIVLTLGRVRGDPKTSTFLAWPYPIDDPIHVRTREAKRLDIQDLWHALPEGTKAGSSQDPLSPDYVFADEYVPEKIDPMREGYCLTADMGVLQARVGVKYQVSDAVAYRLGQTDPEEVLRVIVMSAVTRALGGMKIDDALAQRGPLSTAIQTHVQDRLKEVQAGITVNSVELTYLHPPRHVIKDFQQVYLARLEASSKEKTANAEAVRLRKRAEADALTTITNAENYKKNLIERARGEAAAFKAIASEYRKAPDVVASRIYYETIEQIGRRVRLRALTPAAGAETTIIADFDEPLPEKPK